ncbi:MAG: hypothetical protein NTW49_11420 [Bacteroidia bacterium]|nr:hypothetical protein [Bacteroidia bacterium]
MRQIFSLLTIIFLLACGQQPSSQSLQTGVSSKQLTKQHKKIKSKTILEYFTNKINNDSESIKKKTIELFDTSGICIDRTIYNEINNEILVEHFYIELKNDTMFKYWKSIHDERSLSLELSAKETYLHNRKIAVWSDNKGYVSYLLDGDEAAIGEFGIPSKKLLYYGENGKLARTIFSQNNNWITTEYLYLGDKLKKMTKASLGQESSEEYYYDSKGRKIKQICFYYINKSKTKKYGQWHYRYNDKDSIISSSHYDNDKLILKYEYIYNNDGNVVLENAYCGFKNNDTTRLDQITEYYYNSSKLLVQKTIYFENYNHPFLMEYYKFDSINYLVEARKFVNNRLPDGKGYFDRRTTRFSYTFY